LTVYILLAYIPGLGVERRVWGYATPYPEAQSDPNALNKDSIYEGQVSLLELHQRQNLLTFVDTTWFQLLETFQFVQIPTLGCIKLGALFSYRRIFCLRGQRTGFDVITRLAIVIRVLWTVAIIL